MSAFDERIERLEKQVAELADTVRRLDDWRHEQGCRCHDKPAPPDLPYLPDVVRRVIAAADQVDVMYSSWNCLPDSPLGRLTTAYRAAREAMKEAGL